MKLSIISDTHNKHKHVTGDLPGGDLLIHAGDLSSMGYEHEIREFLSGIMGWMITPVKFLLLVTTIGDFKIMLIK